MSARKEDKTTHWGLLIVRRQKTPSFGRNRIRVAKPVRGAVRQLLAQVLSGELPEQVQRTIAAYTHHASADVWKATLGSGANKRTAHDPIARNLLNCDAPRTKRRTDKPLPPSQHTDVVGPMYYEKATFG